MSLRPVRSVRPNWSLLARPPSHNNGQKRALPLLPAGRKPALTHAQNRSQGGALSGLFSDRNLKSTCLKLLPLVSELLAIAGSRSYSQRSPAHLEEGHVTDAIVRSNRCLIMTGAGMSAEGGIPTLTEMKANPKLRKLDLLKFSHAAGLKNNETEFWKVMSFIWQATDPKPNNGHKAVALFEANRRFGGLVTQNVDGVHQDAGSADVLETHGTFRQGVCTECRTPFPIDIRKFGQPAFREQLPLKCNTCGSGTIRPNVVTYGESLDSSIIKAVEARFREADMILVIGSQGKTGAVAQWLRNAHKREIPIYEININPTEVTKKGLSKGIFLGRASSLMPILQKGGLIPEDPGTKTTLENNNGRKNTGLSEAIRVSDTFLKSTTNQEPFDARPADAEVVSATAEQKSSSDTVTPKPLLSQTGRRQAPSYRRFRVPKIFRRRATQRPDVQQNKKPCQIDANQSRGTSLQAPGLPSEDCVTRKQKPWRRL